MVPQFNEFERLFLLEFFVDYVNIQNASFKYIDSTMCVSFQFLHYPNMRVCESDFVPFAKTGKDTKIIFKTGKSCLFSVHSDENRTISSEFNLRIVVCQRMKCNDDREHLGEAVVSLGHSFVNLLKPPPNMSEPSTGMRHDLFPLKDPAGRVVGSVAAFARISCFGKLIVTQFQLAQENDANYMFKGTDADKLFKEDMDYPHIEYEDDEEEEDVIPKDTPYNELFGYPKESEEEFQSDLISGEQLEEGEFEGEYPCGLIDTIKEPHDELDIAIPSDEIYKEMGAVVNGHTIIIRVLKKRKKEKKSIDEISTQTITCCCPSEPPICPFAPKLNVCDCDFPLPPELIPRCPPTPCCMAPSTSPPSCCMSLPAAPPSCCMAPPLCPPPLGCCCAPPAQFLEGNNLQDRPQTYQKPFSNNCPKQDCSNIIKCSPSLSLQKTNMKLEPGTVAMKGDEVFFQSSSKPGEPLNDTEKKLTDSLYYKTKCKGSLNNSTERRTSERSSFKRT